MGQIIKIKRGNRSSIPLDLQDGELFLIKDDKKLIIKNGDSTIEIANVTDIETLTSQLSSLADAIDAISENIANLNNEIDLKLTSPSGKKGQILGYTDNNIIQAINAPESGISAITSTEPPENPKKNDLWFEII